MEQLTVKLFPPTLKNKVLLYELFPSRLTSHAHGEHRLLHCDTVRVVPSREHTHRAALSGVAYMALHVMARRLGGPS